MAAAAVPLEVAVRPAWPYRLPRGAGDGVMRVRHGVASRLLHVDGEPVVVHAWQRRSGEVVFAAAGAESARSARGAPRRTGGGGERELLEQAIERTRFALGVDEDLRPFYERFRRDPVLGPAIRKRPWLRARKRAWAWEALAWAVTAQLIEATRAADIQRRIVYRWGSVLELSADTAKAAPASRPGAARRGGAYPKRGVFRGTPPGTRRSPVLRDVPSPATFAGLAPAELAACDLAPSRAVSLIRCAREVAAGRVDPADPAGDRRLRAIPGIGPWTLQCLGLGGRGDPDALPAGDLAYVKLVGRLAGLGRRATIDEIEEFYAPYEPYRGWAGYFTVVHYHAGVPAGPPLRLAA